MQRNVYPDIECLSHGFAGYAATVLQNALAQKQKATLVVPGGNTPRYYLPALAHSKLPWHRITVTLSDERWVDADHEQSNERLIKQHLMSHLPANANTTFIGLKTRHDHPFDAMDEIHQRLDRLLPLSLTVLGLGEDGHIASLFPGMNPDLPAMHHCVAVAPPIAPSPRVSRSLDMLANSEHIALVVIGKAKRQLLDQLNGHPDPGLPITWLLQRTHAPITAFETEVQ